MKTKSCFKCKENEKTKYGSYCKSCYRKIAERRRANRRIFPPAPISELLPIDENYQINKEGQVYTRYRQGSHGRQMKTFVGSNGYPAVKLFVNGKYETMAIHILLARVFIPLPFKLLVVNHKNGIKTDHRIENLEWCTQKYNVRHAFSTHIFKRESKTGEKFISWDSINKKFKVSVTNPDNSTTWLGRWKTLEEAKKVRDKHLKITKHYETYMPVL